MIKMSNYYLNKKDCFQKRRKKSLPGNAAVVIMKKVPVNICSDSKNHIDGEMNINYYLKK